MAESFLATLERELLGRRCFPAPAEALLATDLFIEGRNGPHRRHSALGQRSPVAYERLLGEVSDTPAAMSPRQAL